MKIYVGLFKCMITKAYHPETISDMTSKALLGDLMRFIHKGGIPSCVHFYNGLKFVEAKRKILKKKYLAVIMRK